jgi:hypothetical protein
VRIASRGNVEGGAGRYSPGFGGNCRERRAPSPPMSALGHKRTLAALDLMSAIGGIADIILGKADISKIA